MASLLRITGATIERVAITALREDVYYALIVVAFDRRVDQIDTRPSDALNLAERVGAPILVDEEVVRQAAMPAGSSPPGDWCVLSAELLQSRYGA